MHRSYSISFLAAIVFGAHSLFNGAHSWPLLWPIIGGILAVITSRRHGSYRYKSVVQSGMAGGLLVWLICLFGGWYFSETTVTQYYQAFNEVFNDPSVTRPSLLFASAAVALTYIAAWLFSSAITTVITHRKAV